MHIAVHILNCLPNGISRLQRQLFFNKFTFDHSICMISNFLQIPAELRVNIRVLTSKRRMDTPVQLV